MARENYLSFSDRAAVKAASRANDARALAGGQISRAELRAANGVFACLNVSAASIRRRGMIVR